MEHPAVRYLSDRWVWLPDRGRLISTLATTYIWGSMRISELSRQAGAPVATIKFYLREGLLPPGEPTARNQAEYSDVHVARVRLIRTLTSVGQLSLSAIREVLAAVDAAEPSVRELSVVVNRAMFADQVAANDIPGADSARRHVDKFLEELGWEVRTDSPGRQTLAHTLAALRYLGWDADAEIFLPYAAAAQTLARQEHAALPDEAAANVARSVLLGVAFTALRQLAREDAAAS
jgi:DNA-binding transcriptional MerR regulator